MGERIQDEKYPQVTYINYEIPDTLPTRKESKNEEKVRKVLQHQYDIETGSIEEHTAQVNPKVSKDFFSKMASVLSRVFKFMFGGKRRNPSNHE